MTELELHEAETVRILKRATATGRPLKKKKRPIPSVPAATTRALREAGVSEADATLLLEAVEHERRYLAGVEGPGRLRAELPPAVDRAIAQFQQEQVGSSEVGTNMLMPPTGWTQTSTPNVLNHPRLAGHTLTVNSDGSWAHRLPDGTFKRRGQGQQSLTEYAKTIPGDWGGSQNASESLIDVLHRIRGTAPRPEAEVRTHRLIESIREAGRVTTPGDLHARLRAAATRAR